MFFRSRKFANSGSLGPAKSQIRGCAEFGNFDSVKRRSHEHAEARNLNCWWSEFQRFSDSGIWWRPCSGLRRYDTHEPAGKRKPLRESAEDLIQEFWAKTFTNHGRSKVKVVVPKSPGLECEQVADLWICKGGKDILMCVHIRNILRARGWYRNVKVPSSPYKRGRKGTCKRIQTFWDLCYLQGELQSLCALTVLSNVLETVTCVRVVFRIFRVPPQQQSLKR
jgi:hypothetical protein